MGTLIAALLVSSVGSVLYYQNKLNEVPQVPVPAVVNVSRDDADNQLRNRGFVVEYRTTTLTTSRRATLSALTRVSVQRLIRVRL